MKKIKPGKGVIYEIQDAKEFIYDPKNFTFEDFEEALEYERNDRIKRKKRWDEENKEVPLTPIQIAVHKRSDKLLGNYPMNKERLLELIELIDNAVMQIDFYGGMVQHKGMIRMWIQHYGDEMTTEQLYMNYLKDVKPYIFRK